MELRPKIKRVMLFNNKIVWITGASSGIGEATAYRFAQEGAKLVLTALEDDLLAKVAEKCKTLGAPDAKALPFDISQTDQLDGLAEQDPDNSTILSAQAYCYYKLENRDKAFELYLKILEREPDNYAARFNYASLLAESGDLQKAMETYQQLEVFSDSASDAQLYFEMAKVSYSTEDYEKAVQYGEKALSLDSGNIEISRFLLNPYEQGEYYAKYLETADVVIDYNLTKDSNIKNSENAELYFKKCDIYLNHTGNFAQGAAQLKKAIAAGFQDKEKLEVLYDNKELLNSDEIRSIIDKTGLLNK